MHSHPFHLYTVLRLEYFYIKDVLCAYFLLEKKKLYNMLLILWLIFLRDRGNSCRLLMSAVVDIGQSIFLVLFFLRSRCDAKVAVGYEAFSVAPPCHISDSISNLHLSSYGFMKMHCTPSLVMPLFLCCCSPSFSIFISVEKHPLALFHHTLR